LNGSGGSWLNSSTIRLTDGGTFETVSAFFGAPVNIDGFQANFTYTDVSGTVFDANGACFVLQNDPAGAAVQGGANAGLGYSGITNSFALEINLFKGNGLGGCGVTFGTNGSVTQVIPAEGDITNSLTAGDPIEVALLYSGGVLSVSLTDAISNSVTFSSSFAIDLPTLLGADVAYVGFTAATADENASVQTITGFEFQSITTLNLSSVRTGADLIMSWPVGTPSQLQVSTDLINWTDVATPAVVSDGQNQVTLPMSGTQQFFRLLQVQ
jgi:hypothetical protein